MSVTGIICEYDPLHTGHAWLMARARAISQACPVWRGSYSQMMPVTDIVVLLGAILCGIAEHFSARLGYAENRSCVSRET